ncbi:MAG: signal peptidase I [Defluviitaleaceae bacterium]|nr:signal peptidase I [Defluviitaleaceae bacterium]
MNLTPEIKAEIISWIKTVVFAVIFALFITRVVIVNATVPTGSMENTIMPRDRIVASRLAYISTEPQRFDVVVFRYPDDEQLLFVKRIIGLPGETVTIREGKVYIDDSDVPLTDSFTKNNEHVGNYGPFTVPENSFFMLGDNRGSSSDSRSWTTPFLNRDKILGKVVFRYFPNIMVYRNIAEGDA